jgi:putative oxidoreductase
MKMVVAGARILLGLIFVVFGLNGFLLFLPPPPPSALPHNAAVFSAVMWATHYTYVPSAAQVLGGLFLLLNRYVPLALVILAGVIVNILTFHITMMPQALFPMPILVVILWFITAWPLRGHFAPLLTRKAS